MKSIIIKLNVFFPTLFLALSALWELKGAEVYKLASCLFKVQIAVDSSLASTKRSCQTCPFAMLTEIHPLILKISLQHTFQINVL